MQLRTYLTKRHSQKLAAAVKTLFIQEGVGGNVLKSSSEVAFLSIKILSL
jgi:hypothetical protein